MRECLNEIKANLPSNVEFDGELKNGLKHGDGRFKYDSGNIYKG